MGLLVLLTLLVGLRAEASGAPRSMSSVPDVGPRPAQVVNAAPANLLQAASGSLDDHPEGGAQPAAQGLPVITWATPAPVRFATALDSSQLNATANVPGTFSYSPAAGAVMKTAGSIALSVVFTPTDKTNYKAASARVFLVVYKGNPLITWPKPASLIVGAPLGASQLKATANVPGVFSYSPAAGTVMSTAGTIPLSVVFTPTDTADYKPATATVSLVVTPGTPVITWPKPASVQFGTALGSVQLNATASVPGTFAYSPAAGVQMHTAGLIPLSVVFTPTDTADYKPASATVYLGVYKGNPAIKWNAPPSVPVGTSLGPSQLDAGANVPGTFSYSPGTGTVLNVAGSIPLSVVFTPTDTADYKPATVTVFLAVAKGLPALTWPLPAAVAYDTALSAAQLDCTASVPGTFTYSPAAGTVMSTAGSIPLKVTFTPTDKVNYKPTSGKITLLVHKAMPIVTWANPPTARTGTALDATQLNATASVPGTFAYWPAAGTVMNTAGPVTLSVVFTPTDAIDYHPMSTAVSLSVIGPDPAIRWPLPQPVPTGTPLGTAQLNATATVPGTFTYSPAAGTRMNQVGTQTLSVVFTPTDTLTYPPTSATVALNVFDSRLTTKIQHVVVVMQENRSFDNLFNGYPGADTVQSGITAGGAMVPLKPIPLEQQFDVGHGYAEWWTAWDNGNMDGYWKGSYAYVPQSEVVPLWDIASAYTLADRMFQSNSGPSFNAHQYMIAGQSGDVANNPSNTPHVWGCDSLDSGTAEMIGPNGTYLPGGFPCYDYQTMADLLDAKGQSWAYYAPLLTDIWSAYDAISHIRYGPDWNKNIITPSPQVLTDIQNGKLAAVTWVIPDGPYSDHAAPGATALGPDWVASIVNAVGSSPYWNSTVILISWDDWGGWYDHVPPPQIDEMGLGFRVPLLVVSPWAKHGYISHQQHEFGSFLKLTEEAFNLPSLGTRDAVSDDLSDCFDFDQTPTPFTPIPAGNGQEFFIHSRPSGIPPDDD
ncbi:MAG TPA: alkaline phosphatase family protein [Terracidiphilus sp.]